MNIYLYKNYFASLPPIYIHKKLSITTMFMSICDVFALVFANLHFYFVDLLPQS